MSSTCFAADHDCCAAPFSSLAEKIRALEMGRVLERTKGITGWEIAVFLRLSAKLGNGSQVLRCDREEALQCGD